MSARGHRRAGDREGSTPGLRDTWARTVSTSQGIWDDAGCPLRPSTELGAPWTVLGTPATAFVLRPSQLDRRARCRAGHMAPPVPPGASFVSSEERGGRPIWVREPRAPLQERACGPWRRPHRGCSRVRFSRPCQATRSSPICRVRGPHGRDATQPVSSRLELFHLIVSCRRSRTVTRGDGPVWRGQQLPVGGHLGCVHPRLLGLSPCEQDRGV